MDPLKTASEHFFKGLEALGRGDLAAAEASLRQAQALVPGRPSVLANLSLVYLRMGRPRDALPLAETAARGEPADPLLWMQLGAVQLTLGQAAEALASFDVAIARNAAIPEAHNNRGNALKQLGRLQEALASHDAAIALKPGHAEAHNNRGVVMKELGRPADALASYETSLRLRPDNAETHNNRGSALRALGRPDEALASYDVALRLRPDYAEAHNNRGVALKELGRIDEAVESYDRSIALKPDYAEAYSNRGVALTACDRLDDAIASHDRAIALAPASAEAHSNRSVTLSLLRRLDEALADSEEAIRLRPDLAEAHGNRGVLLQEMQRYEEALACFEGYIALMPGAPDADRNRTHCLLQIGRYREGFASLLRKRRENTAELPFRTRVPWWDGRPLDGKLLLWGEQGVGDEVFYASLLPLLKEDPARVTLAADKRLLPAYRRSFPGTGLADRSLQHELVESGGFAAHASIGDLGSLLEVDGDALRSRRAPFLFADQDRTGQIRAANPGLATGFVCGIAWRSSNKEFGAARSIPLAGFAPLLTLPGVRFVNLQYGDVSEEIAKVAEATGRTVHQAAGVDVFNDIEGLLALIDLCDAVVTIDNVTAHLAGAIGKPGALMVPAGKGRIWYWQDGPESDWYPSLRLVHQSRDKGWPPAIDEAAVWLADRAASAAR